MSTPLKSDHRSIFAAILAIGLITPTSLLAHGEESHTDSTVSIKVEQQGTTQAKPNALPENIASIGGPFSLVNHLGQLVTDQTYAGKHMLVFFGYSNCQIMCSISLRRIADALAILQAESAMLLKKIHPLVITVDPESDTPSQLRRSLSSYHPALTGLTGTLEQLKPVYKAYGQKPSVLEMELNKNPIVSHSSYFYLMDQNGKLQTLFPPILSSESMAELIKRYLSS